VLRAGVEPAIQIYWRYKTEPLYDVICFYLLKDKVASD